MLRIHGANSRAVTLCPPSARQAWRGWAEAYDHVGLDMRSRARHEEWMAALPCRLLRIEREASTQEQIRQILAEMPNNALEATS